MRVVNENPSKCSGRLEILMDDQWGTVCDDYWGINEAEVVCRQLGCGKALSAEGYALFLQGSGPILVNYMNCTGNEDHFGDCNLEFYNYCSHSEDASVICEG